MRELLATEPASRPVNAFEVLARLSQFAAVDFEASPAIYLRAPPLVATACAIVGALGSMSGAGALSSAAHAPSTASARAAMLPR